MADFQIDISENTSVGLKFVRSQFVSLTALSGVQTLDRIPTLVSGARVLRKQTLKCAP